MLGTARRAANQAAPEGDDPEVDIEAIAARLPGQKRPKPKAARGGFFTYEKAGSRPLLVVGLVALLAAGAGMLYGTLAERPQPLPVRMEKPKAPVGKIGSAPLPMDATQRAEARPRNSEIIVGANTRSRSDAADDTIRVHGAVRGSTDDSDDSICRGHAGRRSERGGALGLEAEHGYRGFAAAYIFVAIACARRQRRHHDGYSDRLRRAHAIGA